MNSPAEEAASHAAAHINKTGLAVSWAGNGLAWLTLHQAELQTIILLLTGTYTLWQFGRDIIRDKIRDSREKMAQYA